jgi:hypothetical protein
MLMGVLGSLFGMVSLYGIAAAVQIHRALFLAGPEVLAQILRAILPDFVLRLGPGSLPCSFLLAVMLSRRSRQGLSRGDLLKLSLGYGMILQTLTFLATLVYLWWPSELANFSRTDSAILMVWAPMLGGGLGLDLGCFWGLPRKEAA